MGRLKSQTSEDDKLEEVNVKVDGLKATLGHLGSAFKATSKGTKDRLAGLEDQMDSVGLIEGLNPFLDPDDAPQVQQPATKMELENLTSMVNDLLRNQDHHQPNLPPDTLQRITSLEEGAITLDKKVGGDSTYVFEEYVFGSDLDVLNLLGSSLDNVDVGLFLDLVGATSRLEDSFSSKVLQGTRVPRAKLSMERSLPRSRT